MCFSRPYAYGCVVAVFFLREQLNFCLVLYVSLLVVFLSCATVILFFSSFLFWNFILGGVERSIIFRPLLVLFFCLAN